MYSTFVRIHLQYYPRLIYHYPKATRISARGHPNHSLNVYYHQKNNPLQHAAQLQNLCNPKIVHFIMSSILYFYNDVAYHCGRQSIAYQAPCCPTECRLGNHVSHSAVCLWCKNIGATFFMKSVGYALQQYAQEKTLQGDELCQALITNVVTNHNTCPTACISRMNFNLTNFMVNTKF